MKKIILIATLFVITNSLIAQNSSDTIKYNDYGKLIKNRALIDAEFRDGFLVLESEDGQFKTWFDTRAQLDMAYFFDKNTNNPIGNGLSLRRARFAMKTILWGNWKGEVDLDFSNSQLELKDAYVGYMLKGKINGLIKAGNFKEGFSMETTTTSRYITFIERSLVSKMMPSRHLGINGSFYQDKWLAIAGIHFRDIGDLEEAELSKDNNKIHGTDEGYSLTGRFVYRPIIEANKVLHIGAAISYRTPKTHLEVLESYRMSTRSFSSINRKKYLDTDDIKDVSHNVLTGFELAACYNNFFLQSEYMMNSVYRKDDAAAVTEGVNSTVLMNGFYAQAGVLLFGGKYIYNPAEGEFTQLQRGKDWGDLEFAVRYDYLNLTDLDAEVYGGAGEGISLGLNYYPNTNVKIMLNYTYANHDRFANYRDALFVGTDENGVLTKDPFKVTESNGSAGEDFDMILLRLEIDF